MMWNRVIGSTLLAAFLVVGTRGSTAAQQPKEDGAAFFEKEVRPILEANCFKCHGPEKQRASMRLDSRGGLLQGGDLGPAFDAAKPQASRILQAINYRDGLEMPPKGKLPGAQIDTLTRWIIMGAPYSANAPHVKAEPKHAKKIEDKNYWAYQPLKRPAVPKVKHASWVKSPVDALLLAPLEAKGLAPVGQADKVTLVRRAYFDLLGLPPTPEQVDAFVEDKSDDAFARLIDQLLESPQYGEKWGRHWLDLVRYAETNGYERDGIKPFAWRYRDYVIRSFNQDKPYDVFLKEQIAGDELPGENPDAITATGYYRMGLWDDEPADPKQSRFDELDDIVATTSQVVLGMTMNCARCHDHKIDPILQKDYYSFLAFFQDVEPFSKTRDVRSPFNLTDISPPEVRAKYESELKTREKEIARLTAEMAVIEDAAIKKMPAEDQRAAEANDRPAVVEKIRPFVPVDDWKAYSKLKRDRDALRKRPDPGRDMALSVNHCRVPPPKTHILIRGNPHSPGAEVAPAFPTVLGFSPPALPAVTAGDRTSRRRTALADWLTSTANPLTARVMANRLIQYHFGRGIVASSNDFGKFGTGPSNQPLLDWLAVELMEGGWKLKRMHKLVMLSNAYQMNSTANAKAMAEDPGNLLLWRYPMRRLSAEEVRDAMLSVAGKLNFAMGGPSVYPPIPKEVLAGQSVPGQGWGKATPEDAARRSIYVHVKRSLLVPILSMHDQADTDSSCAVRYTTTVPTQALGMLNGEFTREQAAALSRRLQKEKPGDLSGQITRAIRLITGRAPAAEEVKRDLAFVGQLRESGKLTAEQALERYCLVALNTNEFIYLD